MGPPAPTPGLFDDVIFYIVESDKLSKEEAEKVFTI